MSGAAVPTMVCPRCKGDRVGPRDRGCPPWPCPECDGTGSVERPALVRGEVLRLPVGCRVIVEERRHDPPLARVVRMRRGLLMVSLRGHLRTLGSMHRVWLAEEADG